MRVETRMRTFRFWEYCESETGDRDLKSYRTIQFDMIQYRKAWTIRYLCMKKSGSIRTSYPPSFAKIALPQYFLVHNWTAICGRITLSIQKSVNKKQLTKSVNMHISYPQFCLINTNRLWFLIEKQYRVISTFILVWCTMASLHLMIRPHASCEDWQKTVPLLGKATIHHSWWSQCLISN